MLNTLLLTECSVILEPKTLALWKCFTVIWKEGNVLFNDALNTFYLRLYGVGHMVKNHSDSERGNPLPPHGLLSQITSKGLTPHGGPIELFLTPANAPRQRPWYVLSCLWNGAYKKHLAANKNRSPCSGGGSFPLAN